MSRALLLLAALFLGVPAHPAEFEFRRIAVSPQAEGYFVDAVMVIPVPPALAWEVMTDFDAAAKWVPNLRSSRVLRRDGNSVLLEQVGVAQFGPFSFDFTLERRLDLDPPSGFSAVQTRGTLKRYQSILRLEPENGATRLSYRVDIEPGLLLGTIVTKDFVEHEFREQFDAIAAEMVRRRLARAAAGTAGAAAPAR